MYQTVDLDQVVASLDELLTAWGIHNQTPKKHEVSNTGKICDFLEMFSGKKRVLNQDENIRRDLVLGLPTKKPKLDLGLTIDQVDRIFGRPDLWVFHTRDREILKKYYADLNWRYNPYKVARRLSIPGDKIPERELAVRLRKALIYFWRIHNA